MIYYLKTVNDFAIKCGTKVAIPFVIAGGFVGGVICPIDYDAHCPITIGSFVGGIIVGIVPFVVGYSIGFVGSSVACGFNKVKNFFKKNNN